MDALWVISSIPSLKSAKNSAEFIKTAQGLVDILTKRHLAEKNQLELLLIIEFLKVAAYYLRTRKDSKPLKSQTTSLNLWLRRLARTLRPFLYLCCMTALGRRSKLAFLLCLLLDLASDHGSWSNYVLRYPVYDKLLLRILPKWVGDVASSYAQYVTYVI